MKSKDLHVLVLVEGGVVKGVYANDANINITLVNIDNIEDNTVDKLDLGGFPVDCITNARMQEIIDEYNEAVQENIDMENEDGLELDWD